jgi:hypothetical protein
MSFDATWRASVWATDKPGLPVRSRSVLGGWHLAGPSRSVRTLLGPAPCLRFRTFRKGGSDEDPEMHLSLNLQHSL